MSTEIHKQTETFADRLRTARKSKALGQTELAEKIDVSKGSIGNWEIGPSQPRPETLGKLAAILEVSPAWLLYGEENKRFELGDKPIESRRPPESSHLGYMELSTLEKYFTELAAKLQTANSRDRKYVLGNLRAALDELDERELPPEERLSTADALTKAAIANAGKKG